jgi:hypothetical protein
VILIQLRSKCAICGNDADFCITQVSELLLKEPITGKPRPSHRQPANDHKIEACGLSRCPICNHPSLVLFECARSDLQAIIGNAPNAKPLTLVATRADVAQGRAFILATFPKNEARVEHPSWPTKVGPLVLELQDAVDRNRHAGLIIAGCRSIIDVATRALNVGDRQDLRERIDALAGQGVVTGSLRDWAHKVRLDGNLAVHEIEGTSEDARELVEFVKLFLQVCFELPHAIAAKQHGQSAAGPENTPRQA